MEPAIALLPMLSLTNPPHPCHDSHRFLCSLWPMTIHTLFFFPPCPCNGQWQSEAVLHSAAARTHTEERPGRDSPRHRSRRRSRRRSRCKGRSSTFTNTLRRIRQVVLFFVCFVLISLSWDCIYAPKHCCVRLGEHMRVCECV